MVVIIDLNILKKCDLPDNYKKSSNLRPHKVSYEYKKWSNEKFKCEKSGTSYKNSYKDLHNKKCKPLLSDELKKEHQKESTKRWQNKEFKCLNCGKSYKNSYRF